MKRILYLMAALMVAAAVATSAHAAAGKRVKVTGEVIDTWCYITQIMYPEGTAHRQCALWCAAGGIPVGIKGDDGKVYLLLKVGDDATSVANPAVLRIQSHRVSVDANLIERDGMNYLLVDRVVRDDGIVNLTHDEYGIQP